MGRWGHVEEALRWISGAACAAALLVGVFSLRRGWVPPWLRTDSRSYGWFLILLSPALFTMWVASDQEPTTSTVLNNVALLLIGIASLVYLVLRLSARRRGKTRPRCPSSSTP
jgi:apolipoprotein N-acyltransferase